MENKFNAFFEACDDFINCKFLVAEYKLQRMLQVLSQNEEICSLIGECLEQFNRDREFAKAFIQDGHGDYICDLPTEEYKVIAFVFCTLVDIDNKKIDLVEFVKRFYGREENPFRAFINQMVVPFRNLLADAFGYPKLKVDGVELNEEDYQDSEDDYQEEYDQDDEEDYEDEDDRDDEMSQDEFLKVQKLAVQIMSELQYYDQSHNNRDAIVVCKAIVKTTELRDSDITYSLALALKACKAKQVKFLVHEILDILNI